MSPGTDHFVTLRACADMVNAWFLHNYLMLNTKKTEAVLFGTDARLRQTVMDECVPFSCSGPIAFAKSIHLMGVTLDTALVMDKHVKEVVAACSYHLQALKHIRPSLTVEVANTIAHSLVLTRMDYCNSLLYATSAKNMHSLQVVQNRAARVVLNAGRLSSATSLLRELHWLPVNARIRHKIGALTYKALSIGQPSYLADLIVRRSQGSSLRSGDHDLLLVPPRPKRCAEPSFTFSAPEVWNSIPDETKNVNSYKTFCGRLKTALFSEFFSSAYNV